MNIGRIMRWWWPEVRLSVAPLKYTKVNKDNYKFNESSIGCQTCEHRATNFLLEGPCMECRYSGNVKDQNGQIS